MSHAHVELASAVERDGGCGFRFDERQTSGTVTELRSVTAA